MHRRDNWTCVVVRCRIDGRSNILWKISDFLEQDEKVKSFHFRFGGTRPSENRELMLYICFRIFRKRKDKEIVENSVESMLRQLAEVGANNFKINPSDNDNPFNQYVGFSQPAIDDSVNRWGGEDNWKEFMLVLANLSKIVADLSKNNLFATHKRADVLHLMANMLQLHEIAVSKGAVEDFITREVFVYR